MPVPPILSISETYWHGPCCGLGRSLSQQRQRELSCQRSNWRPCPACVHGSHICTPYSRSGASVQRKAIASTQRETPENCLEGSSRGCGMPRVSLSGSEGQPQQERAQEDRGVQAAKWVTCDLGGGHTGSAVSTASSLPVCKKKYVCESHSPV